MEKVLNFVGLILLLLLDVVDLVVGMVFPPWCVVVCKANASTMQEEEEEEERSIVMAAHSANGEKESFIFFFLFLFCYKMS